MVREREIRWRPRVLGLLALAAAVGIAMWAGGAVRERFGGPGPVETVRRATLAYASGDCAALRSVSERPASVDCTTVTQVQQAYRDEGLVPATFTYDLVAKSGGIASVRISYVQAGKAKVELIRLEKQDSDWKIAEASDGPTN